MLGSRLTYYAAFTVIFGGIYFGILMTLERFPVWLLFLILLVSLGKDLVDEYRIRKGNGPLAFASIEHNPSNFVLAGLLLSGVVEPTGTVAGLSTRWLALGLAIFDAGLDGWQDVRMT